MSVSSIVGPNSNFGIISTTQSKKYIPSGVVLTSRLYSGANPSAAVTAAGAIPGLVTNPADSITSADDGNSRMLRVIYQKIGFCSMLRLEAYETLAAQFGAYLNNVTLNVADTIAIDLTLTLANEPDLVRQLKEDLAVFNISTRVKSITENQYAASSGFKENGTAKLVSVQLLNNLADQVTIRLKAAAAVNFGAVGTNPIVGTYLFFNSSSTVL